MGTIGVFYKDFRVRGADGMSTPNNLDFHKYLNMFDDIDFVVTEVTSHAIDLDRVYGLKFDVVLFTNITLDHLNYHKTMEKYIECKLRIFDFSHIYIRGIMSNLICTLHQVGWYPLRYDVWQDSRSPIVSNVSPYHQVYL